MTVAYLSVGSNLGDRLGYLTEAVRLLHRPPMVQLTHVSSVYETAPQGKTDQPAFLNAVAAVETTLEPHDLLNHVMHVERELKRIRTERWGPRTIDIDIIVYDDLALQTPDLELPHPRMHQRAFVLVPLLEVGPALPYREALAALPDQGVGCYLDAGTFLGRIQGVK